MHIVMDPIGDHRLKYEGFRLLGSFGFREFVHHPPGMRVKAVPCRRGMNLLLVPDTSAKSTYTTLASLAMVHGPGYQLLKASARRVSPGYNFAFHHTRGICMMTDNVPNVTVRTDGGRRVFRIPYRLIGTGTAAAGPVWLGHAFAIREVALELPPCAEDASAKFILEVDGRARKGLFALLDAARLAFATQTPLDACYRIKRARESGEESESD
jgi:hypothetical protein